MVEFQADIALGRGVEHERAQRAPARADLDDRVRAAHGQGGDDLGGQVAVDQEVLPQAALRPGRAVAAGTEVGAAQFYGSAFTGDPRALVAPETDEATP